MKQKESLIALFFIIDNGSITLLISQYLQLEFSYEDKINADTQIERDISIYYSSLKSAYDVVLLSKLKES